MKEWVNEEGRHIGWIDTDAIASVIRPPARQTVKFVLTNGRSFSVPFPSVKAADNAYRTLLQILFNR